MKIDSTQYSDTVVTPKGSGFTGKYLNYFGICAFRDTTCIENDLNNGPYNLTNNVTDINFQNPVPIAPGISTENFACRWDAYFQATSTGNYFFQTASDDGVKLWINGSLVLQNWKGHPLTNDRSLAIWMQKGKVYKLQIYFYNALGPYNILLQYKSPDMNAFNLIPREQLYLPDHISDTAGTVITKTSWCTRLDSVNVRANALNDTFSLLQNKKMLISAWVKEGGNDCKCSSYVKNNITISFNNGDPGPATYPSGSIIEGWQRYESVFTIPADATSIKVSFNNNAEAPVYFDDIRIQPFNANVKSFVYHPSNLRLMSELDENNYATFYEYDDDGTLTRVKKETQKGIKTITETRSAMQEIINQ